MNFEFSEEHRMIRDMVRDFANNEIAPGVQEREERGEFPRQIIEKAAELGLCGVTVQEKYGGAGLDKISSVIAISEIAAVCPSTAIILSAHNDVFCMPVQRYGTEEQKERFLAPAASGRIIGAFCLSEPGAGSDAGNIIVKAVEDGDEYVIEGTKSWVTSGDVVGAYIVIAVTGQKNGRKEISAFLMPADNPGIEVGKVEDKMGLRSSKTTAVVFEGCRVGKDMMLGGRGEGLKIALSSLDGSRIGIAAQAIGIGRAALDEAVRYSQERVAFGKPISRHQAIGFMLADCATELEAAEMLTYRAAWMHDQGVRFSAQSSMAKMYATEAACRMTDRALQIHGAYGYCKEYKIERLYRDVRVTRIYEGTNEIQRMVIARDMLKE